MKSTSSTYNDLPEDLDRCELFRGFYDDIQDHLSDCEFLSIHPPELIHEYYDNISDYLEDCGFVNVDINSPIGTSPILPTVLTKESLKMIK